MPLTAYCRIFSPPEHPGKRVLFCTRTAASLLVPAEILDEIARDSLAEEERATLAAHGLVVDDAAAEKKEMLAFVEDLAAFDQSFKPLVVLNLDCNLACNYCFEGSRKGRHYLSDETADALLHYLRDHALLSRDQLHVTFYGGEPLLSFSRILDLVSRTKALCDQGGLPFRFSLITNGTLLTRDRVDTMQPLGLKSASVTLDGPRDTHDAARPYREGRGSYDVILRNLKEVAALVDLQIGGNFTRENWRAFPALLDDLIANGLTPEVITDIRFDPVFRETEGIAPPDCHGGCVTFDQPWLLEAVIALREEILRRGYKTGRVMPSPCMMDFPNHPVINYDGAIYGCPGLIGRKEHRIGTLGSGEIGASTRVARRGGPPSHGPHKSTMEIRGDRPPATGNWKNEQCLACAYLPLCLGGCRYMTLLADGTMGGLDCRKPYFDAVLEPLVLQDLRYRATA